MGFLSALAAGIAGLEAYVLIFWHDKLTSYQNYDSLKYYIEGCLSVARGYEMKPWVNHALPPDLQMGENASTHCEIIADAYRREMLEWYFKVNSWSANKVEPVYEESFWRYYNEFLDFLTRHAGISGDWGRQYHVTTDYSDTLSDFGLDLYKVIYATSKAASEFGMPEYLGNRSDQWLPIIKSGKIPK